MNTKPGVSRLYSYGYKVFALLLLGLSLCLGMALFSNNPADPSWNFLTNGPVYNWLGRGGARVSDFCLQWLGQTSYFLPLILMFWAGKYVMGLPLKRCFLRFWGLCLFLALGSILMASLAPYAGGAWGEIIYRILPDWLRGWQVQGFLTLLNVWLLIWVSGISIAHLKKGYTYLYRSLSFAWSLFVHLIQFFRSLLKKRVSDIVYTSSSVEELSKPSIAPTSSEPKFDLSVVKALKQKHFEKPVSPPQGVQPQKVEGEFPLPSLDLLSRPPRGDKFHISQDLLLEKAQNLKKILSEFSVKGEILNVHPGPVVSLFELEPAAGIKSSRVISLAEDIARSMHAVSARVSIIKGRNIIGIELPNETRETIYFRTVLESLQSETSQHSLLLILGQDIAGKTVTADLAKMPHLLVAGTTGSGKSVGLNAMILSLLYRMSPHQCRFVMIDPKMLELSVYNGIPHLLSPVITDPKKAVQALKWVVLEMENRYRAMSQLGVRNMDNYNQRIEEAKKSGEVLTRRVQTGFDDDGKAIFEEQELNLDYFPFIVVIVDEMADLMLVAGKDIEIVVQRLAQMARAAGIHLIMATQRPSVDVITGTIKANFPSRISFHVTSKIDSRTILGEQGAEQLLGHGDMLYMSAGGNVLRVHGPFVSDKDVEEVVSFLKNHYPATDNVNLFASQEGESEESLTPFESSDDSDQLYQDAVNLVIQEGRTSASYLQRCLTIGYNRASKLIERMEKEGIVSKPNASGKRTLLVKS